MADDKETKNDAPGSGIFGQLPDSRPGTRSPRRKDASDPAPKRTSKAKSKPKAAAPAKAAKSPAAKPKPKPAKQPATASSEKRPPQIKPETAAKVEPSRDVPPAPPERSGLEDLAWAGVAAAAEAATLGVKIAGKALDALKGSPGKR